MDYRGYTFNIEFEDGAPRAVCKRSNQLSFCLTGETVIKCITKAQRAIDHYINAIDSGKVKLGIVHTMEYP